MGKGRKRAKKQLKKPPSIYEPLPEGGYIRILVLQPGSYDDEIVCELEIQSYTSTKTYSAISYVWGDSHDTTDIRCNGLATAITVNLANALRQFRSPHKSKRLWADALCINQKDDEEKGHQVSHMGKVYSNAKCVLVWLGLDGDGIAKDCFESIHVVNELLNDQLVKNGNRLEGVPRLKLPHTTPTDRETWRRVYTLMRLPWFTRVWTVQECALANRCRMFWGSVNTDFVSVVEISLWCRKNYSLYLLLRAHALGSITQLAQLFQNVYCYFREEQSWQCTRAILKRECQQYSNSCLARILAFASSLGATYSRDYVYAFLGCKYAMDQDNRPLIEANYADPLDNVFYDIASSVLKDPKEGPWILSCVTRSSRLRSTKLKHPTWVTRWHRRVNMLADPALRYQAGGPLSGYNVFILSKLYLRVSGFIFDKIVWKTDKLLGSEFLLTPHRQFRTPDQSTREPFLDRLSRVVNSAALELRLKVSDEDLTSTLITQDCDDVDSVEHHRKGIEIYRRVAQALAAQSSYPDEDLITATKFARRLAMNTSERCLFLTRNGAIGLAPGRATEVGDSCCIFMGVTVPFVVAPGYDGRYRLVGECYVRGAMRGELVDQFQPTGIVLE